MTFLIRLKHIFVGLLLLFSYSPVKAGGSVDVLQDSVAVSKPQTPFFRRPKILSLKYNGGTVLHTDEVISGNNAIKYAHYGELKFSFGSVGDSWQDIYWGMPYYGLGVGIYDFGRSDLGNPKSIYLIQGANLARFTDHFMLKYEWNLGASLDWNAYDPVKNPRNTCVGSKVNVYIAGNLYFSWMLCNKAELRVGGAFNHISNGSIKSPNSGINQLTAFVELAYNFNGDKVVKSYNPFLRPPKFQGRLISDFGLQAASRQRKLATKYTGLSSSFIDRNFPVYEFSYGILHMPTYKFRYGPGVELVYDESAQFMATKTGETADGKELFEIRHGSMSDRFAVGLTVRTEIVQSHYIIFAQLGYKVYRGNNDDARFYQAIGVKIPFRDQLYGSFAIHSKRFAKAQYLFFGLGYSLNHKPFNKKNQNAGN